MLAPPSIQPTISGDDGKSLLIEGSLYGRMDNEEGENDRGTRKNPTNLLWL